MFEHDAVFRSGPQVAKAAVLERPDLPVVDGEIPPWEPEPAAPAQPPTINSLLRIAVLAFGFTSVIFAALADPIVRTDLPATYHSSGSVSVLFGPVLAVVLLLWAALSLLLFSAQRPNRWRVAVWSGLLIAGPWVMFRLVVLLWISSIPPWLHFPRIALAVAAWLLVLLLWRPAYRRRTERIIEFVSTTLICLAFSGALVLAGFMASWWGARHLNDPQPLHRPGLIAGVAKPPILWILLDELSYDQVYGHRFPGLQLPAFDALAAQSTVFTHVIPAGIRTERVMPSLIAGRWFGPIRSSVAGELLVRDPGAGKWVPFPEHQTVFQDALNRGYQTGIVGWYNPYCRIMPDVLFRCDWSNQVLLPNGSNPNGTFGSNVLGIFDALLGNGTLRNLLAHTSLVPLNPSQDSGQIQDYRHLVTAGDQLLADPFTNFALLHMPFPHPPGYYDRVTGQLTTGGRSYIDNLALADRYLAHVHAMLEAAGEWNSATVIVMGDHSWRTAFIWKNEGGWTPEEERASGAGHFDDRPGYILKLPNQQTGQDIDAPFHALSTRNLLDALIDKRIRTAQDLRQWVGQGR